MRMLDQGAIISHGRYLWGIAMGCGFLLLGLFVFATGIFQVIESDYGFLSISGVFACVVMAVVLAILGYKMGLAVILDLGSVVSKIRRGDYRIVLAEVVSKGGCTTCSGVDNGTGLMFSDGGAYVDNTGRRKEYDFGDRLYLIYLGDEKYPVDVFDVREYQVPPAKEAAVEVRLGGGEARETRDAGETWDAGESWDAGDAWEAGE